MLRYVAYLRVVREEVRPVPVAVVPGLLLIVGVVEALVNLRISQNRSEKRENIFSNCQSLFIVSMPFAKHAKTEKQYSEIPVCMYHLQIYKCGVEELNSLGRILKV